MRRLRLVERIDQPCKAVSEDLFDCNAQAAWIFDGATGIVPDLIAGAPSDPYWLVHAVNAGIQAHWDDAAPTRSLLRAAAEDAIARFLAQAEAPVPPMIDRPTACLLMARLWQGGLELSTLGDCWLLRSSAGRVSEFGSKLGDEVAGPVRQEMARLKAAGFAGAALFEQLLPMERQFRATANTDGGYPVVDLSLRWIDRITQASVEALPGDQLLLMTDGLYRLIDTFRIHDGESLMRAALDGGLAPLLAQLRALEAADERCEAYPRAKVRDDVAAALLVIA